MNREFLELYNRELGILKEEAKQFAVEFPGVVATDSRYVDYRQGDRGGARRSQGLRVHLSGELGAVCQIAMLRMPAKRRIPTCLPPKVGKKIGRVKRSKWHAWWLAIATDD